MAAHAESRLRAQRRFYRELTATFDQIGVQSGEARAALTLAALRLMYERLCAGTGVDHPLTAGDELMPADTPPEWGDAVRQLLDRWDLGQDGAGPLGADALGYVFEQSLARKELGAYFTAPDVAAYICRGTLLPRLFELVGEHPDLREVAGEDGVIRYLAPAVRQAKPLPLESDYEWRRRRQHLAQVAAAFAAGEITTADDCLTWNLDLTRVALDCIERCPDTAYLGRWEDALAGIRVLDPTCGCGDFLLSAHDLLALLARASARRLGTGDRVRALDPLRSLYGVDILPGAAEVTRMRLSLRSGNSSLPASLRQVIAADFLSSGPGAPSLFSDTAGHEVRFDAVVGNPPYVSCAAERERYRGLGYETAGGGNLYSLVMERSLSLLAKGGRLGMIVPISSASLPEFAPLVRRLTSGSSWLSTYSNRPAKLFEGVEQRLAVWITAPDSPPRLYTSAYQHWWREERPQLFDRLRYCETAVPDEQSLPVKLGCAIAERIYRRIIAHRRPLRELVGEGEQAVWLHDGPTYWVRALPFQPNEALARSRSGHYHRLPVPDSELAHLLAAVLSSSTFYLFFKWTSNCRDLGRKDWSGFPIDPLPRLLGGKLVEAGVRLAETLRATAAQRTRVYPSGSVSYEEYYPARAKRILDEIDRTLAQHYGFEEDELEYILSCDLKYRMGRQDAERNEH